LSPSVGLLLSKCPVIEMKRVSRELERLSPTSSFTPCCTFNRANTMSIWPLPVESFCVRYESIIVTWLKTSHRYRSRCDGVTCRQCTRELQQANTSGSSRHTISRDLYACCRTINVAIVNNERRMCTCYLSDLDSQV